MTLGRQNVLIALFVAIPAALIIFTAMGWLERRDRVGAPRTHRKGAAQRSVARRL